MPVLAAADDLPAIIHDYGELRRPSESRDRLPDRTASALADRDRSQDRLLQRLRSIDPATLNPTDTVSYAILLENLSSLHDLQVCHSPWWNLNHITGWQVGFPAQIAQAPVATAEQRERALRRWASLPDYLHTDIANLRAGLAHGYSVPRRVVDRVLQQIDALLATEAASSPLFQPARTATDAEFQQQWNARLADSILPAIRDYAAFLRREYRPVARRTIGLSALPQGRACYAAWLRRATTLDRSPQATFALGQATVAQSRSELQAIGDRMFGTRSLALIQKRAKSAPDNRFTSPEDLMAYSRSMLQRSVSMSAAYFTQLPTQPVEIAAMPDYQHGSGISSHYEAVDSPVRPAYYRINLDDWADQTRGAAAVTVVHETIPGHHLQTGVARGVVLPEAVADSAFNAAYVEGWANYVERLCEETGIYDTPYAAVFRRSVRGQSLMIDPAIHVMGWSRARVRQHLKALGLTDRQADDTIDRIAVQPAQLTAYETGGLEILALREQAQQALGGRFDIRDFHRQVLQSGDVPLITLRHNVQQWIRRQ